MFNLLKTKKDLRNENKYLTITKEHLEEELLYKNTQIETLKIEIHDLKETGLKLQQENNRLVKLLTESLKKKEVKKTRKSRTKKEE